MIPAIIKSNDKYAYVKMNMSSILHPLSAPYHSLKQSAVNHFSSYLSGLLVSTQILFVLLLPVAIPSSF